jgi:CHAT domain-containing protein
LDWASQNLNFSLPACSLPPDQNAKLVFRWKGIVLDSLLEDAAGGDNPYNGKAQNTEKISVISANIRKLKNQLASYLSVSDSKIEEIQDNIQVQINNLESQVANRFKEMVRSSEWSTYDELKSSLVKGDVLIEFIKYNNITDASPYYGIAITSLNNEPRWISLDSANLIDLAVSAYRKAITSGDEVALKTQMQFLFEKIWKPIATALPPDSNKIYIGADGLLNFLSFATLEDDQGKFLSEKYQIAYVGSGRDLLRPANLADKKSMIIYANPLFNTEIASQTISSITNAIPSLGMRAVELSEFANVQLPQLPGTEQEAFMVSQIAKSAQWSEEAHLGADASKKGLMAMKAPTVLHLATHGFFLGGDENGREGERGMKIAATSNLMLPAATQNNISLKGISPMRQSGVALTGGQSTLQAWGRGEFPDPSNDGILTAEEVAGLDLNGTWLVTLSACETGVGQLQSGEGVFGLRRAFMMAGAQNLLMTLWPVSDEVTPKIMSDFYKEALANHDAVGALNKVQRDWLVKLRNEKGLLAAVRDAGPFAMVVMANPNSKKPLDNSNNTVSTLNANSIKSTPDGDSQDILSECVKKSKAIMDQSIHIDNPKIRELCTKRFKALLEKGLRTTADDPGFFEADFRYDTQDDLPRIAQMGPAIKIENKISVPVKLQYRTENLITKTWVYVQEDGQWLADDMQTQKEGQSNVTSLADELTKYKPAEDSQSRNRSPNQPKPSGEATTASTVLGFNDALSKADAGDAYAQAVVSIYYGLGYKVQKDLIKSAVYASKSAEQGDPLGLYRVGVIIQRGEGVPKNESQGIAVKLKARKGLNTMANDPYAITALAIMEFRGEGVPKNKYLAAMLYKKAADMGYAPAQYNYSCLLSEPGSGGNLNEAASYKQKAAIQGYPPTP